MCGWDWAGLVYACWLLCCLGLLALLPTMQWLCLCGSSFVVIVKKSLACAFSVCVCVSVCVCDPPGFAKGDVCVRMFLFSV